MNARAVLARQRDHLVDAWGAQDLRAARRVGVRASQLERWPVRRSWRRARGLLLTRPTRGRRRRAWLRRPATPAARNGWWGSREPPSLGVAPAVATGTLPCADRRLSSCPRACQRGRAWGAPTPPHPGPTHRAGAGQPRRRRQSNPATDPHRRPSRRALDRPHPLTAQPQRRPGERVNPSVVRSFGRQTTPCRRSAAPPPRITAAPNGRAGRRVGAVGAVEDGRCPGRPTTSEAQAVGTGSRPACVHRGRMRAPKGRTGRCRDGRVIRHANTAGQSACPA